MKTFLIIVLMSPLVLAASAHASWGDVDVVLSPYYYRGGNYDLVASKTGHAAPPFVSPDSYYVLPGGSVSFAGMRFLPNEDVSVQRNGAVVDLVKADSKGSIRTPAYAAGYSSGVSSYRFAGVESRVIGEVGITVGKPNPWITLSSYYRPTGSIVTLKGNFFGAYEPIWMFFEGKSIGTTVTDRSGAFSRSFTVPLGSEGKKTVEAVSQYTGVAARTSFSLAK